MLDSLSRGQSVLQLLPELRRRVLESEDTRERLDALFVLGLFGEDVVALLDVLSGSAKEIALLSIMDRFHRLSESIRDAAVRSVGVALNTVPAGLSDGQFVALVQSVLQAANLVGGVPWWRKGIRTALDLGGGNAPRVELLAEYWAYVLSGQHPTRRGGRSLAGILKKRDAELTRPTDLFVESVAAVARSSGVQSPYHVGWRVDRLAPPVRSLRQAYWNALDVLSGLETSRQRELIPGFWGHMKLVISGDLALGPEMVALGASDLDLVPPSCVRIVMRHGERGLRFVRLVVGAARRVSDPYCRFRALIRLATSSGWRAEAEILELATVAASEVEDPHERIRVLEALEPFRIRPTWQGPDFNVLQLVGTGERSFASGVCSRQACAESESEDRKALLFVAIHAIEAMAELQDRLVLIQELPVLLGDDPALVEAFRTACARIEVPWLRRAAQVDGVGVLEAFVDDQSDAGPAWAIVSLASRAAKMVTHLAPAPTLSPLLTTGRASATLFEPRALDARAAIRIDQLLDRGGTGSGARNAFPLPWS